jgi:AraC-like DNA-binding protein
MHRLVLRWVAAVFAVGFLVAIIRPVPRTQLDLWPTDEMRATTYTDSAFGGSSKAHLEQLPGRLRLDWKLEACSTCAPFMGLLLEPHPKRLIDLSRFDSLELEWESDLGTPLRVILLTDEPGFTRPDKPLSRRYLQIERSPAIEHTTTSLPLSQFQVPAWWFRETGHPMDPEYRPLDRVGAFALEAGESVRPGAHDVVRLKALRASGPGKPSIWGAILALATLGCLIGSMFPFKSSATQTPSRTMPEPAPTPVPLQIEPSRTDLVRTWLLSHYQIPDLTLEQLGREIGVGEDTASAEIRKAFGETFKPALNRIRLAEARRLLASTDLGIAEIAFKVGYGNIPHFNRVAKDAWGRTPSEERLAAKSKAPEPDPTSQS